MHKHIVTFLSVLTIITTVSLCSLSAEATKEPSVVLDNSTNKSKKEKTSNKENSDSEKLLDNTNLPILCVIVGIAIIGTTYFKSKKHNEYNSDDYLKYNEKSYYNEENIDE